MEAGQVCASKRLIHHRYLLGRLCAGVQASGHPQQPNFLAHGSHFPDSVLFPCELQLGRSGLKGHPRQPSLPRIVERTFPCVSGSIPSRFSSAVLSTVFF